MFLTTVKSHVNGRIRRNSNGPFILDDDQSLSEIGFVRIIFGPGSKAAYTSRVAGVDARRATPPDPRLPRWGLAGWRQLDPSHPALVTCEDAEIEPCPFSGKTSESIDGSRASRSPFSTANAPSVT